MGERSASPASGSESRWMLLFGIWIGGEVMDPWGWWSDFRYWIDRQICWWIGHRSNGSCCGRCGACSYTPERGLRIVERWHAWKRRNDNPNRTRT